MCCHVVSYPEVTDSPSGITSCPCRLPALIEGDAIVFESVACLLWLLEQHGERKGHGSRVHSPPGSLFAVPFDCY